MGYPNFDAAWGDFYGRYDTVRTAMGTMDILISSFEFHITQISSSQTKEALIDACACIRQIRYIFNKGFDYEEALFSDNCFYISIFRAAHEPIGGEVTMDSLLSAMVTATDPQLMNFIGLVDAYRQSLWNKPFNAELFAALAKGFT